MNRRLGVRVLAWMMLIGLTTWMLGAEDEHDEALEGVRVTRGLVYRTVEGRSLRLDLYQPETPGPETGRPLVLAVHGGGWQGGSRREIGRHVAALAQHGYLVAAVDYRLARRGRAAWPGNLEDLWIALAWLVDHAEQFEIDRDRLVVLGASAGGHLATLMGTHPEPMADRSDLAAPRPRIASVIAFYPPTDLPALRDGPHAEDVAPALQGLTGARDAEGLDAQTDLLVSASPQTHVGPEDPPMLLIHGGRDPLVPVAQSRRFAEALNDAGGSCQLWVLDEAGHGFMFHTPQRALLGEILAFLDQTLAHTPPRSEPNPAPRT